MANLKVSPYWFFGIETDMIVDDPPLQFQSFLIIFYLPLARPGHGRHTVSLCTGSDNAGTCDGKTGVEMEIEEIYRNSYN